MPVVILDPSNVVLRRYLDVKTIQEMTDKYGAPPTDHTYREDDAFAGQTHQGGGVYTDPAPVIPASYNVPWLTFLDRLTDANADEAIVFMASLNAKVSERMKAEGLPNGHSGLRTWLTNRGEDPDAVLAYTPL